MIKIKELGATELSTDKLKTGSSADGKSAVSQKGAKTKKPITQLEQEVKQEIAEETKHECPIQVEDSKKTGQIYCWNVNGVRATLKSGSLVKFLTEKKPDILCLNETKIDEETLEKENVKNQLAPWFPPSLQFWNCCKIKKGYSGCAILVSKEFCGGLPIKVEYDFGREGLHD